MADYVTQPDRTVFLFLLFHLALLRYTTHWKISYCLGYYEHTVWTIFPFCEDLFETICVPDRAILETALRVVVQFVMVIKKEITVSVALAVDLDLDTTFFVVLSDGTVFESRHRDH